MIHWYRKLYMDEKVGKNPGKSRRRVMKKKALQKLCGKNYYVIALAQNPENIFEIMGTRQFFFRRYERMDIYVVGLAADRKSAIELTQEILVPLLNQGEVRLREHFPRKDFW